jgi:PKD repeat protein
MRGKTVIVSAWAIASGLSFFAAAPAAATVVVLDSVTPQNVAPLLSASQRLVWDRESGKAVAEVTEGEREALTGLHCLRISTGAGAEGFREALAEALPEYRPEDHGSRYALKEPALLHRPEEAPVRSSARVKENLPEASCLFEGFEFLPVWYENGGPWWHYQGGQPYNNVGDYFWMDTNCDAFAGSWDADAVLGGTYGITLPCGATYSYNTDSWLEYAPWITCVSGVPQAALSFFGKVSSETGYDFFYYVVSVDGSNYVGYRLSGNFGDVWYAFSQDMRTWTQLGDLTAYPQLALAFVFQSDNQINQGFGARLDNISIAATALSAVASADVTSGHPPLTVNFTGSAAGGSAPYTYSWDFGDGSPRDSSQNPSHTYTTTGSFSVRLTVQDSAGATTTGGLTVTVTPRTPPAVTGMQKLGNPFRIKVFGANFQPGTKVYIEGTQWPNVTFKNSATIVLKGGASLKAWVPKGISTVFLFENPDGDTATYTWQW